LKFSPSSIDMINKNRRFENTSHDLTFYDARNQILEILLKKKRHFFLLCR
jgi:hypothetical protein